MTTSPDSGDEVSTAADTPLAVDSPDLADIAITAQERTDLKLGDVSARLDYLREQNESLQKILKEVE